MNIHDLSETPKHAIDALSIATLLGTFADMLPQVAAGFTLVWTLLRLYDWFEGRLEKRAERRRAKG